MHILEKKFFRFIYIINGTIAVCIFLFRNPITHIYIDIPEIQVVVSRMMIYLSVYCVFLMS